MTRPQMLRAICGGFILLQDGTGEAGATQVGQDNGYHGYDGPCVRNG
jgi:hypothetical protein